MSPKVSKPSLKAITPNEVKNIFGNVSLTNFYAVNFSGFGNSAGNLAKLSEHMEAFGVNISDVLNNTGLMCTDASLPGSSLATAEVKDNFMGIPQEYAHTRLYTDIDFTFYIDRNYNNLLFFESWIDYISSASLENVYSTNYYRRMRYPDNYKCSTMTIKKFERDLNTDLTYLFVNAFPKTVTAVPVSYGPADVLRVTVSFNYDRYIVNPKQTVERGIPTEFNNSRNAETKMIPLERARSLSRTSDTQQPSGPPGPPAAREETAPTIEPTVHATTYKYDPSRNYGIGEGAVVNFTSRGRNYYAKRNSSGDIVIKRAGLAGEFYGNETSTAEISKDGTGRSAWLFEDLYKATRPSTGDWGQQYGPMASDSRLKENIVKVGNSPSGIGIYEWNYKSAPNSRYQGVMAQEVMQIVPEAVYSEEDGFLSVYYDMLDVDVKLVSK